VLRQIARDLAAAGSLALRFDFSGNGQSEGRFAESTYSKQIAEVKTAAAFLRSRGTGKIGLAGHSLGAVVALLTAAEVPSVFAVCAIAGRLAGLTPFHFLDRRQRAQVAETGRGVFTSRGRQLEITRDFFSDADQYRPSELVAAFTRPILVVHGDRDDVVPVTEAEHARELNPAVQLAVIRDADHMFSREDHRLAVSRRVVDWFVAKAEAHASHPTETAAPRDR
jgi:putative redox protein